jgi:hypothetical protein
MNDMIEILTQNILKFPEFSAFLKKVGQAVKGMGNHSGSRIFKQFDSDW